MFSFTGDYGRAGAAGEASSPPDIRPWRAAAETPDDGHMAPPHPETWLKATPAGLFCEPGEPTGTDDACDGSDDDCDGEIDEGCAGVESPTVSTACVKMVLII